MPQFDLSDAAEREGNENLLDAYPPRGWEIVGRLGAGV